MHAGVGPPVLDEETKNALIQRGRDEVRASFIKSSQFQILCELCTLL